MVHCWDLRGSQPLLTLRGHAGPVTQLAFLQLVVGGEVTQVVLSASEDWTVRVWDGGNCHAANGGVGAAGSGGGGCLAVLAGHGGGVTAMLPMIAPPGGNKAAGEEMGREWGSGPWLYTGAADGCIAAWDIQAAVTGVSGGDGGEAMWSAHAYQGPVRWLSACNGIHGKSGCDTLGGVVAVSEQAQAGTWHPTNTATSNSPQPLRAPMLLCSWDEGQGEAACCAAWVQGQGRGVGLIGNADGVLRAWWPQP